MNKVAIIGIAARFPGASDYSAFWENLCLGRESVSQFSEQELLEARIPENEIRDPDYVRAKPILENIREFDAEFFGFSPMEANISDPQQRIFFECVWNAIEDAGYNIDTVGRQMGVFAGTSMSSYLIHNLLKNRSIRETHDLIQLLIHNDKDHLATRISYKFNFTGPSVNLNTACSTSLVATEQAVRSLLGYQCDMALAGGVSITVPEKEGYLFKEGGIVSPDGHCRAFDADGRGTVFGHGAGVVLLKRLDEALEDGDHIYAVISGASINNDGSAKAGYTAPSVGGQAAVIAEALALADVDPGTIGYIEAHGTATLLGDPVEIRALKRAYEELAGDLSEKIPIGSVKSNIGHLDAAAGIAGLIKTALMLKHQKRVPTLHFKKFNPEIEAMDPPFYVQTALEDWEPKKTVRTAAVSSFGVGGTNAHVILEEAPSRPKKTVHHSEKGHLFVFSSQKEKSLTESLSAFETYLDRVPDTDLTDLSKTLFYGRKHHTFRYTFYAKSINEIKGHLKTGHSGETPPIPYIESRKTAFIFPGQGAQFTGMGSAYYEAEPEYRHLLDEGFTLLKDEFNIDLTPYGLRPQDSVSSGPFSDTDIVQPAVYLVEVALSRLLLNKGAKPDFLAGHSLGEWSAAAIAGICDWKEGLRMVAKRGECIAAMEPGAMVAVSLTEREAEQYLNEGLSIASINTSDRLAISGSLKAVDDLESKLESDQIPYTRLRTSHAFHSPMLNEAADVFRDYLSEMDLRPPQIAVYSNVTGKLLSPEEACSPNYWADHILNPVRLSDMLDSLLNEHETVLLEVGPGHSLSGFAMQSEAWRDRKHVAFRTIGKKESGKETSIHQLVSNLWACGALSAENLDIDESTFNRIPLPGYQFDRKTYWIEPDNDEAALPLPGEKVVGSAKSVPPEINIFDPAARAPFIRSRLIREFSEKSGIPEDSLSEDTGFTELGLDSLSLVQVNRMLKEVFNVKIPFRRLLQELSTIEKLAAWLEEHADIRIRPEARSENNGVASESAGSEEEVDGKLPQSGGFGPYKKIRQNSSLEWSDKHQKFLDRLEKEYIARTKSSREYAEKHRRYLADARMVTGYQQEWKNLVYPIIIDHAEGSVAKDVDGNEYIDLVSGFGVNLLGNSPEILTRTLHSEIDRKRMLVAPQHELVGEAARLLTEMTGFDRACFCNTGSEAVMTAMRLARLHTGRKKIALFAGSYHGNFDNVLARKLYPREVSQAAPVVEGITDGSVDDLVILEYGSDYSLKWLEDHIDELAAVMVEPVQTRKPGLQPHAFLQAIRQMTKERDTAFIIDEVVCGFRIHQKGARGYFNVDCDISTYGKVIGSGLPVGALAGSKEYMDGLDGGQWSFDDDSFPEADQTFFAGTFTKHPYTLSVLIQTLEYLKQEGADLQKRLNKKGDQLIDLVNEQMAIHQAPILLENCGSILHFTPQNGFPWLDLFLYQMVLEGVYVWGQRPYYLTTSHTDDQIRAIADAAGRSAGLLSGAGIFDDVVKAETEKKNQGFIEVPLTEEQHEIWLASSFGEDAVRAYNSVSLLKITGELNRDLFLEAIEEIPRRHESLRATISEDGDNLIIHTKHQPHIDFEELSFQSDDEKAARINRLKREEHHHTFDLINGPLYRFGICKTGENEHLFYFSYHHIICDGWSFDIIIQEILTIYAAKSEGLVPDLNPANRFSEVALNSLSDPAREKDLEYWVDQFRDELPVLELPVDQKRTHERSFRAGTSRRTIDGGLYSRIRKSSAKLDGSLFHLTYATFVLLLNRLTGQNEVVLGISYAGQQALENDRLVGHCVELLPVLNRLESEQTFTEFLSATSAGLYDAIEHHHCTYGTLLKALKPKRDGSRTPLVSAIFNIDRMEESLQAGEITLEGIDVEKEFTAFEISMDIQDTGRSLKIQCYYNRDLFDESSIDRWLVYYENLLNQICGDETFDRSIHEYHLEPKLSETSAIKALYHEDPDCLTSSSIVTLFEKQVKKEPDAIALISANDELTYQQFNSCVNQLTHYLIKLGAGRETCVGICLKRSIERMVAIYAVMKAGGAYLPIDPEHPRARVQQMLEDADPLLIITSSESDDPVKGAGYTLHYTGNESGQIHHESEQNPNVRISGNQLAYVIFTSGSTGKPKGVMIEHKSLVNRILWMQKEYPLTPSDRLIQKTPYTFDVSVWELFWWGIAGASLCLTEHNEEKFPEQLEKKIHAFGVTHIHFVPTMLDSFLDYLRHKAEPDTKYIPSVTTLFASGEALTHKHVEGVRELLLCDIHNLYGPTEATVDVSYFDCSFADSYRSIPIGKPISNTALLVLSESLQIQPAGVPGELYIGGAGVGRGYMNRPDLTEERFIDNPFSVFPFKKLYKTGDKALLMEDGQIGYLGRIDFQLKVRGNRIEAGEVASALTLHPDISDSMVADSSAYEPNPRLVAWFTWEKEMPDVQSLRNWLAERLPAYMIPSLFIPVDEWPLTSSGKLDRKSLPWKSSPDDIGEISKPQTEIEKILVETWEKVLDHTPIGIDDDFFTLGGDSILSIRIVNLLRQSGLDLTPRQLFRTPTIRSLAQLLSGESGDRIRPTADLKVQDEWMPVQKWFLDLGLKNPDFFHQTMWFRLQQEVSADSLREAFHLLTEIQPALRLRIDENGNPFETTADQPEKTVIIRERNVSGMDDWKTEIGTETESLQRAIRFTDGPVIGFLKVASAEGLFLFVAAHHMVIDGVSWRILIDDLKHLLNGGKTDPISLNSTPGTWAAYLSGLAGDLDQKQLLSIFGDSDQALIPLPNGKAPLDNLGKFEEFTEYRADLQASKTLLDQLSHKGGSELNNWILTAVGKAFCRWAGIQKVTVDVENNGRDAGPDQPDISKTMGWFTAIFPVTIDMDLNPPELSEKLGRLSYHGLEYGIAHYWMQEKFLELPVNRASILFNYLGKTDAGAISNDLFEWVDLPAGRATAPENQRSHLFEVEAGMIGEQILIRICFPSAIWNHGEMEALKALLNSEIEILTKISTVWSDKQDSGPEKNDNLFTPEIDLSNLDFQ